MLALHFGGCSVVDVYVCQVLASVMLVVYCFSRVHIEGAREIVSTNEMFCFQFLENVVAFFLFA